MNAALLISVVALLLGIVNTWLVVSTLWGRSRVPLPLPRSTSRRKIKPLAEDVVAGLEEWPSWTMDPARLQREEPEEDLPGDPSFKVKVA